MSYWSTLLLVFTSMSQCTSLPFQIPKSDILHASSGLIFHYLSNYSPADRVVSLTVSIPMTKDMCFLIPLNALRKIPDCQHIFNAPPNIQPRRKRFLTDIISIGVGSAALSLATYNTIQILRLQTEVKTLTTSFAQLQNQVSEHTTQLLHVVDGQIKIANELNHTQAALNRTIAMVNDHSSILERHQAAIETLASFAQVINNKLTSFIQSTETHFLHSALSDILANRLNLHFIHHNDLPTALNFIVSSTKVSFNQESSTLSLVDLVSQLLMQQRVDFAPSNVTDRSSVIGTLLISSFFAASTSAQPIFFLYELVPIPFTYNSRRVRLADIPFIIGIDIQNDRLLRWSKTESELCNFRAMSVCRESPPIITNWNTTCLFEILIDTPLTSCHVESFADPLFIHRIGHHWAISTNFSITCHTISTSTLAQSYSTHEAARVLPPVALITVPPNSTLVCDRFSLPSLPFQSVPSLSILDTSLINASHLDFFNLHLPLSNASRWEKLPFVSDHVKTLLEFLASTPQISPAHSILPSFSHPFYTLSLTTLTILTVFLSLLFYFWFCRSPITPTVHLELASIK